MLEDGQMSLLSAKLLNHLIKCRKCSKFVREFELFKQKINLLFDDSRSNFLFLVEHKP